jgi:hypothetical protein
VAAPTTPRQQTDSETAETRQSAYMVFKEERQWDTFRRSTIGHARAQGVLGVLDPNFVPRGYDELDLFCITTVILVLGVH